MRIAGAGPGEAEHAAEGNRFLCGSLGAEQDGTREGHLAGPTPEPGRGRSQASRSFFMFRLFVSGSWTFAAALASTVGT